MTAHPGISRRLARLCDEDGLLRILAIDHLSQDFDVLLAPEAQDHLGVVRAKSAVIEAVADVVTGVLIDPPTAGAILASGGIPSSIGLVTAAEDETYTFPDGPRGTRLRDGWGVDEATALGADMLKVLWFYRPDLDEHVAAEQRELLADLAARCDAAALPLVVEPIWFAVDGEDPQSPQWRTARHKGVVGSAAAAAACGAHLLKVEFPGDVATEEERAAAGARCAEIDAIGLPWVLLSAGVSPEAFEAQLEIACTAGCIGFMAGRSVWRSAVDASTGVGFEEAIAESRERLERLNAIVRSGGRARTGASPLAPRSAEQAVRSFGPRWYLEGPRVTR